MIQFNTLRVCYSDFFALILLFVVRRVFVFLLCPVSFAQTPRKTNAQ